MARYQQGSIIIEWIIVVLILAAGVTGMSIKYHHWRATRVELSPPTVVVTLEQQRLQVQLAHYRQLMIQQ